MLRPLFPEPALLVEQKEKILVVGDIHLGYEFTLAEVGINIPSQTQKILNKLIRIVDEIKPSKLIFLGDVKQSVPRISFQEWRDIPSFFEELGKHVAEIEVVPGNHDGDLEPLTPRSVRILPVGGVLLEDVEKVGLFHGHAWPDAKLLEAEHLVLSHNHPAIQFTDSLGYRSIKPVWMRIPIDQEKAAQAFLERQRIRCDPPYKECFREKLEVALNAKRALVLPTFNEAVGGLAVNVKRARALLGPMGRTGALKIDKAEIYMTDGTYLGTLSNLRRIL